MKKVDICYENAWGNECMMLRADDVLLSCALQTCMILQTNVTQINSIKKR